MSVTPITGYLSIAAWPTVDNIAALRALGVRLIISMTNREPPPELADPPQGLWIDGEECGTTPADIQIVPAAIEVVVPWSNAPTRR